MMEVVLNSTETHKGGGGSSNSGGGGTDEAISKKTVVKYEKVFIPARAKDNKSHMSPLVEIKNLPEKTKKCFQGVETLNRLQTELFHAAFKR